VKKFSADYFIKKLNLQPHPEGGYYREVFRSQNSISKEGLSEHYSGERSALTSIYYLLKNGQKSHFHRLLSDEIWHFYSGGSIKLLVIDKAGKLEQKILGNDLQNGESFTLCISSGEWFAATPLKDANYCLCGCIVAPGFDFSDFEMAKKSELLKLYPQYSNIIKDFCL